MIYHNNELRVNRLNCWYVISEAYNKVNTLCRLLSLVVVCSLTNVDDRFIYILMCGVVLTELVAAAIMF